MLENQDFCKLIHFLKFEKRFLNKNIQMKNIFYMNEKKLDLKIIIY